MTLSFRPLSDCDDYHVVSQLIYNTDPYIYSDLFGDCEDAERVLARLLKMSESIFYHKNYYVATYKDQIAGIAAFYKYDVKWDAQLTKEAFYEVGVEPPESFTAASEYFTSVFNYMTNGVNACNITVSERCRRRGVASFIVKNIIRISGRSDIELSVLASNIPAVNLYMKHGFVILRRFNDYGGYMGDPLECYKMIRQSSEPR